MRKGNLTIQLEFVANSDPGSGCGPFTHSIESQNGRFSEGRGEESAGRMAEVVFGKKEFLGLNSKFFEEEIF